MSSYPPALVADDARLGRAVQGWAQQRLGSPPPVYPFAEAAEYLGPEGNPLLVCAAATAADAAQVGRLLQGLRLRRWPATVVAVASAEADAALDGLERFLDGRLRWPEQAEEL